MDIVQWLKHSKRFVRFDIGKHSYSFSNRAVIGYVITLSTEKLGHR